MFLNKDSITINNVSIGQYLVEAKYGYHKLWASDAGRNLAGVMSGTLVGIFPKITLQFRKLTKSEMEIIAEKILNDQKVFDAELKKAINISAINAKEE